jgi:serine/threonine protein kinase/Tol biopolymer transport system component
VTDDRWPRVKALFQAAVERPADERDAFLAVATGADEGLRREVESLLMSDAAEVGFLDGLPVVSKSMLADLVAPLPSRDAARPVLSAGVRVGPYEIVAALGAGGMGDVYRACDTKLNREVALKVLPDAFASDPDRLARFTREARTLAALNHPNIAHIHGLEEGGAVRALVMELVEGKDLTQRIAAGAIPLAESLAIARQIADALEAAHEQGIIHRDLKPANIKLRDDGTVKVLDFGLAKAIEPRSSSAAAAALANSPTITALTVFQPGMLLGTAAYMSPEQAKGRAADRRSDVWAFGVVLYEMLTGRRPFTGDVVSDTLSSVLTQQPDWTALPVTTPPSIRRLLCRCLEKDRTRRLADIADARLDIDEALSGSNADVPVALSTSRVRERIGWGVALLLVGLTTAAMAAWTARSGPVDSETTRTFLSVTPGQSLTGNPLEARVGGARPSRTAVALSPDGKTLVFGALWGGEQQLYARSMDQISATPILGTSGGSSPFFSPDGRWVGFWAGGELRKVPLGGGPAVTLCAAAALFGSSWGNDGTIVFASARNGGLWRVSAAGGTPEALTTLAPGEYSHRLPHVLPGGGAVIFTIAKAPARWNDSQVVVRSMTTGEQSVLVEGGADGRYLSTGHLVYLRLGTLMAAPFDPVRLTVTGGATGLIDGVMQAANNTSFNFMLDTGAAQLAVSETGALVYVTGGVLPEAQRSLAWVDRRGTIHALPAPPRPYFAPRLSPDGQHVAVFIQQGIRQVWNYDMARGALSAVTVDGRSSYGVFTPDGKRLAFRSNGAGAEDNLYWGAADGSGTAERLTTSTHSQTPASWSADGATLAFVEEGDPLGQFDIWTLSISDHTVRAVIQTAAHEASPEFSPDGRWLAYTSTQSGRQEVYVQRYPGPGERHLISTGGGEQPAWAGDGRELVYVQRGDSGSLKMKLMSVRIGTSPTFLAGTPELVFESSDLASGWGRSYDVAPDGKRFLITLEKEQPANVAPVQMILVQNWFDELKRLVPTK